MPTADCPTPGPVFATEERSVHASRHRLFSLAIGASLLLVAGCTPHHGSWRHGPVDLAPAPVEIRLPHPLNPGRVRAELCLGLRRTEIDTTGPEPRLIGPDSSPRLVLAGGDTVHVRLVMRTAEGEAWAHDPPFLRRRPHVPSQLCFGRPSSRGAPAFTRLELSASRPISVTFVQWTAWSWPAIGAL